MCSRLFFKIKLSETKQGPQQPEIQNAIMMRGIIINHKYMGGVCLAGFWVFVFVSVLKGAIKCEA